MAGVQFLHGFDLPAEVNLQSPKKTTTIREALREKAGASIAPPAPVATDQRAVDEGRKPVLPRRKDTAEIETRIKTMYAVPPAGLDAIPAIESGFQFTAVKSDEEFHFMQVESLLEQSTSLLERCAVDRDKRDNLQLEKWKLQLEVDQFLRLHLIRLRERETGADTLAYERAVLDSAAERNIEESQKNAEAQLKALMDDQLASGLNKRMAARELAAWVTAYPLKDQDLGGDEALYTFDGARKSKADHLYDAARIETDEAAWEQVFSLMARRYEMAAASGAGQLRKQSLDLLAKWCLADIAFRRERDQVAADAVWEKLYQAQSAGSVLNYADRITPLERRFAVDFREALARLAAARRGLQDLYGYAPDFPKEGSAGYFDEVVTWVRNADQRLRQLAAFDQDYVLALSLKDLTKSQWEAGLSSSQWTFDIADDLFPGQAHVRLRGLALAVVGPPPEEPNQAAQKPAARKSAGSAPDETKATGFWFARVSVPPVATIKHGSGESLQLDQKAVPVCYLGRVMDREAAAVPEIAGANVLHNASPLGKGWKLALSSKSTDGIPTATVRDVQIYLHLVVRDQKGSV